MTRPNPSIRWSHDLRDVAAAGEVVVIAPWPTEDDISSFTVSGAGLRGGDLVRYHVRIAYTLRAADGREVIMRHHPDATSPLIPVDTPADLRYAALRAWEGEPADEEVWVERWESYQRAREVLLRDKPARKIRTSDYANALDMSTGWVRSWRRGFKKRGWGPL